MEQRLVYGTAALEQPDKTGETFHYETSVPHFQEWSKEAQEATKAVGLPVSMGNVREMHGKSAAGRLTDIQYDDDSKAIEVCGKVVDDGAWQKVKEGVYTGFSIGGDYVKRWTQGGTKFYTAKPSEISLVDNPAMPGAHFTMVKMHGAAEERSFAHYMSEENTVAITNSMVTERAQSLAKAAGATGFGDFIAKARAQLEKEAGLEGATEANPGGSSVVTVPKGGMSTLTPSGEAKITPHPGGVPNNADDTEMEVPADYAEDTAVGEGVSMPVEGGKRPSNAGTQPTMGKSATNEDPRNEVTQGWRAKDGSFHVSKAAAISHNAKLDTPSAQLDAALEKVNAALSKADVNDSKVIDAEEKRKAEAKAKKMKEEKDMEDAAKAAEGKKKLPAFLQDKDAKKAADAPGDGSKPYGNTTYADPGYKADKKKRYPIDTEAHVRAAWSYINKPANHAGYTAQQLSSVKSKIIAAWKKVIGKDPPSAADKAFVTGQLQKGMHTVSRLACLIDELNWLHSSIEMEAVQEKDGSPVPAQLKGDIASLVGTLKNMVDEETSELFDIDETEEFAEMLEMAASSVPATQLRKYFDYLGGLSLEKSAGSPLAYGLLKAAMPKEHVGKIQEMHDHCSAMGAKCYGGEMPGKAAGIDGGRLAKGMEVLSAENQELRASLDKAIGALTKMATDIEAIKAQPAQIQPVKLQVVDKTVDGGAAGGLATPSSELMKHFSPDLLATAALRLTHAAGGQQIFHRGTKS